MVRLFAYFALALLLPLHAFAAINASNTMVIQTGGTERARINTNGIETTRVSATYISATYIQVPNPTSNNQAASKQYVDTAIAAAAGGRPKYMGVTGSTYNAARGGALAASAICASSFPGSRLMRTSDIVTSDYSTTTPTAEAWIVCDIFGSSGSCYGMTAGAISNCNLWNLATSTEGVTFNGTSGSLSARSCGAPYAFHCVKD